jgi:hypothetical protein
MATQQDIAKVLAALIAAYPSFRPTVSIRDMQNVYHIILGDLNADALMNAAVHYISSGAEFFPPAGKLRQLTFELQERAVGVPLAQEAWGEVKRAFRSGFSRYRVPTVDDWSHPLIAQAVESIGGWRYLCDSENDAADRARFIEAYGVLLGREREAVRMLPKVREQIQAIADKMRRPGLEPTNE